MAGAKKIVTALKIAQLAERCGIQALTIHRLTPACLFNDNAKYNSILAVKQNVSVPVIANRDMIDPQKPEQYLITQALML